MDFPSEIPFAAAISPSTQLLLDEIRKLFAEQSEWIDRKFAAAVEPTPVPFAATSVAPATELVPAATSSVAPAPPASTLVTPAAAPAAAASATTAPSTGASISIAPASPTAAASVITASIATTAAASAPAIGFSLSSGVAASSIPSTTATNAPSPTASPSASTIVPSSVTKMRDEVDQQQTPAASPHRPRPATPSSLRSVPPFSPRTPSPPRRSVSDAEDHAASRLRAFEENRALKQALARREGELQLVQMKYADEACKLKEDAVSRTLPDRCLMNCPCCFSLPFSRSWGAVLCWQHRPWPPPSGPQSVSCEAELRPLPWPSFNMVERYSVTSISNRLWKPPWYVSTQQHISRVLLEPVELWKCLMRPGRLAVIPILVGICLLHSGVITASILSKPKSVHQGSCSVSGVSSLHILAHHGIAYQRSDQMELCWCLSWKRFSEIKQVVGFHWWQCDSVPPGDGIKLCVSFQGSLTSGFTDDEKSGRVLIQKRVQRKCGGLICSQPCLQPAHEQFVQGKPFFDISFDAVHLRPIPWPFVCGYATHVHLKTSLNTMLVYSTQCHFGFWSLIRLGWVAIQYKPSWPLPQSNGTWLQLSASFVITCSLRQSTVPFSHCVSCHEYWKLWLESLQTVVQVAEPINIESSYTWFTKYTSDRLMQLTSSVLFGAMLITQSVILVFCWEVTTNCDAHKEDAALVIIVLHLFSTKSLVSVLSTMAGVMGFISAAIWYAILSTLQLTLWDPGGDPYVLGMNATFPICKSEIAAVAGPAYILLLSLLEELVTEHLSIGKLITPLWYGDAEIFRNAIGPSGASCGVISTARALSKSIYYTDGSQCGGFRDVLGVIFPEVGYDEWYSTQSAIARFTIIHHFEQDASPSSRTVGAVGKPLFMLHFYNLVIEDP